MKLNLFIILLLNCLFLNAAAVNKVASLKAFDGGFRKTPIAQKTWQKFSETILFEWKEPWGDIAGYKYYFGTDINGQLTKDLKETKLLTNKLPNPGVYYFKISAYDLDGDLSPVKILQINYDNISIENTLQVNAFTSKAKTQELLSDSEQELSSRPYFALNTANLKTAGALLKGFNYYWGPDNKEIPNRHTSKKEFIVTPPQATNTTYYLIVNIEDQAGNISEPKTLYVSQFLGENKASASNKSPNLKILNREAIISGKRSKDGGVMPGSIITYEIKFTNNGQGAANNVSLKDSIPENTTYEINSARSNIPANIEHWDQGLNGGRGAWTVETPTNPENIKEIRWNFVDPIKPDNKEIIIKFSVKVNII